MAWWKIFLIAFGGMIAAVALYIVAVFVYAAIQEYRMSKKYPGWKDRGGRRS